MSLAATLPARPDWAEARLLAREPVAARATQFRFAVDWPRPHRAGQYVELSVTAPDGTAATRFFSIASPPSRRGTVDIIVAGDGTASRFFHGVTRESDRVAMRGPFGLPFSWAPEDGGPLLLVGGGSGVVPLLAMARERAAAAPMVPAALLYAARTRAEALCLDELEARARTEPGFGLRLALSREGRRMDRATMDEVLGSLPTLPKRSFVCGSGRFVEAASALMLDAGLAPETIRTERFG